MKIISVLFVILGLSLSPVLAQESCMQQDNLLKIDASWEKAQLDLDLATVESIMAEDFIWVHNHANTIDDKAAVLERVERYVRTNNRSTKSRISNDVIVIISGSTAIVSGYTIIDKGSSSTTYHFMRTYVESDGKCYLIANHTMAVPEKEN